MQGRVVADRYRLLEPIGQGSMGSVWLAERLSDGGRVAVKMIIGALAQHPEAVGRFEREARTTAQIDSPHVVRLIDFGPMSSDAREGLFMALEYLRGHTLKEHIARRGKLPLEETVWWIAQLCRGLSAAHRLGLVHRDVKPANIILAEDAGARVVKILDFGVAKSTDVLANDGMDPTKTGALLGTPNYMSPEQAQGSKSIDQRTDVWAVGVTAFECLTGHKPFQGKSLGPLMRAVMVAPVPKLSDLVPVSAEMDAWMARCLARDLDRRFPSADDVAAGLVAAARL